MRSCLKEYVDFWAEHDHDPYVVLTLLLFSGLIILCRDKGSALCQLQRVPDIRCCRSQLLECFAPSVTSASPAHVHASSCRNRHRSIFPFPLSTHNPIHFPIHPQAHRGLARGCWVASCSLTLSSTTPNKDIGAIPLSLSQTLPLPLPPDPS